MEESAKDFVSHFSVIQDLRIERNKLHKLESILFIAVCSVLSVAKATVNCYYSAGRRPKAYDD